MEIVRRAASMQEVCAKVRDNGRKIGLVPTMGSLHEGHRALIRRASDAADVVVVSIFVNPTQFAPGEDFAAYPRDLTADVDACIAEGVDYVFAPEADELYSPGSTTYVEVAGISDVSEGKSRPGHFRGVATVVAKLFSLVRPAVAVFGQKDAQQVSVVRRLIDDLFLGVELQVVPVVRDEDGLALSSRNAYLSEEERRAAGGVPRALDAARELIAGGERQAEAVLAEVRRILEEEPTLEIDYLDLVEEYDFEPVSEVRDRSVLVLAVRAGRTRLLDNLPIRL